MSFVIAEYKHSGCILHCRPDKPKKKTFPPRDVTNKLFSICSKPLFQSKVKFKAIEMKIFFILNQIEHIFTKKILHLTSFQKREFLEFKYGKVVFLQNKLCIFHLAIQRLFCQRKFTPHKCLGVDKIKHYIVYQLKII